MKIIFFRFKRKIRNYLANYLIYIYIFLLKIKKDKRLVNNNTDIIIEGYSRSGNTFLVNAFIYFSKQKIKIAHHTHSIANIKYGIMKKKKVLVCIRHPINTVHSNYNYFFSNYSKINVKSLLKEYYNFYNCLNKLSYKNIYFINFKKLNNIKFYKKIFSKIKLKTKNLENEAWKTEILDQMQKDSIKNHNRLEQYIKNGKIKKMKINSNFKKEILKNKTLYKKCLNLYFSFKKRSNLNTIL